MSQAPQERLEADLKTAMKSRDATRVSTLRLLLSAVKNRAIEIGAPVDEDELVKLVARAVKQRQEAATQYDKGERAELAAKERAEAEILTELLPPQASPEDIRTAIADLIESEGLSGPGDLGTVMKAMMQQFKGSADGGTISSIARELLSG